MQAEIKVTKVFENLAGIRRALKALTEQDVFIGVPEDKTARNAAGDTGISNAYLSYIHEYGVPEKNIPARPHLIPGIQDIQPEAVKILGNAAKAALEGNEGAVARALNTIGLLGQNAVRARFVDNDWPELSEKTLKARIKPGSKKRRGDTTAKLEGEERVNPLINTGQLRKAQTYVIRNKGNTALVVR
jgi:hypothetical protein